MNLLSSVNFEKKNDPYYRKIAPFSECLNYKKK